MERVYFFILTVKFAIKMFLKLMKHCNDKPHVPLEVKNKESLLMQFEMCSQDLKFVDVANLSMFLDNLKNKPTKITNKSM